MFKSPDLTSDSFKDRKNQCYGIMIYELPEPPAKAVFRISFNRGNYEKNLVSFMEAFG